MRVLSGGSGAVVFATGSVVWKIGRGADGRRKVADEARFLRHVGAAPSERLFAPIRSSAVFDRVGVMATTCQGDATARSLALSTNTANPPAIVSTAATSLAAFGVRNRRPTGDQRAAQWALELLHGRSKRLADSFGYEWSPRLAAIGAAAEELLTSGALSAPYETLIHGDPHLDNLLVHGGSFCWIDPRGQFGTSAMFDPAYDLGKIAHERHLVAAMGGVSTQQVTRLSAWSSVLFQAYVDQWELLDETIRARAAYYCAVNLVSASTFGRVRSREGIELMLDAALGALTERDGSIGLESKRWA